MSSIGELRSNSEGLSEGLIRMMNGYIMTDNEDDHRLNMNNYDNHKDQILTADQHAA